MAERIIKSTRMFWLNACGIDTHANGVGAARRDTPWNAFTQDRETLVCSLWEDQIVAVIDPITGGKRRFVIIGERLRSWHGLSIYHGKEATANLKTAVDRRLRIVGYEALANKAALKRGERSVDLFYLERAHRLLPWIGLRHDALCEQLPIYEEFAKTDPSYAEDVALDSKGYLCELLPLIDLVPGSEATEDQLLELGFTQEELLELAEVQHAQQEKVEPSSRSKRLASVAAFTRLRAKGKCEHCGSDGFLTAKLLPYLESHHIVPISRLGEDFVSNTAALCPNCHREAHFASAERQRSIFSKLRQMRLRESGIEVERPSH